MWLGRSHSGLKVDAVNPAALEWVPKSEGSTRNGEPCQSARGFVRMLVPNGPSIDWYNFWGAAS